MGKHIYIKLACLKVIMSKLTLIMVPLMALMSIVTDVHGDVTCWSPTKEYFGNQNTTADGSDCVTWMSARQLKPDLVAKAFSDETSGDPGRFCRNPDSDPAGPWCLVGTDLVKTYCGIPKCRNVTDVDLNDASNGKASPRDFSHPMSHDFDHENDQDQDVFMFDNLVHVDDLIDHLDLAEATSFAMRKRRYVAPEDDGGSGDGTTVRRRRSADGLGNTVATDADVEGSGDEPTESTDRRRRSAEGASTISPDDDEGSGVETSESSDRRRRSAELPSTTVSSDDEGSGVETTDRRRRNAELSGTVSPDDDEGSGVEPESTDRRRRNVDSDNSVVGWITSLRTCLNVAYGHVSGCLDGVNPNRGEEETELFKSIRSNIANLVMCLNYDEIDCPLPFVNDMGDYKHCVEIYLKNVTSCFCQSGRPAHRFWMDLSDPTDINQGRRRRSSETLVDADSNEIERVSADTSKTWMDLSGPVKVAASERNRRSSGNLVDANDNEIERVSADKSKTWMDLSGPVDFDAKDLVRNKRWSAMDYYGEWADVGNPWKRSGHSSNTYESSGDSDFKDSNQRKRRSTKFDRNAIHEVLEEWHSLQNLMAVHESALHHLEQAKAILEDIQGTFETQRNNHGVSENIQKLQAAKEQLELVLNGVKKATHGKVRRSSSFDQDNSGDGEIETPGEAETTRKRRQAQGNGSGNGSGSGAGNGSGDASQISS